MVGRQIKESGYGVVWRKGNRVYVGCRDAGGWQAWGGRDRGQKGLSCMQTK